MSSYDSLFKDCAPNDRACERDTRSSNSEVAKGTTRSKAEPAWTDKVWAGASCVWDRFKESAKSGALTDSFDGWSGAYRGEQFRDARKAEAGIKQETAHKPCFKDRAAAMGLSDMTDLGVSSSDRQTTQNMVDAVKVIDPRAEVFCNDRNIVGTKPHAEEHNDHVQVKWSGEPCSPTGAKFLETGDAAALQAAVTALQKERQAQREAEEYARCMRVLTELSTLDKDLSEDGWITKELKKMEQNRSKREQNNK